jgi:23S rRNA pseudouridine2605 synthase
MRLNKYIAAATDLSRRSADAAIAEGRISINGQAPSLGQQVSDTDVVTLDGRVITPDVNTITIMVNKPVGYVCSRNGQGSQTVYALLPPKFASLQPVGRLDKDSSGLLLMTSDGQLAHELTHPSFQKVKVYEVTLDKDLQPLHRQMISDHGVTLDDGVSKFELERLHDSDEKIWHVRLHEGRNRQIRRTFSALGYTVTTLHRTNFGPYSLGSLAPGSFQEI